MHRLDNGQPIRDAIREAGLSIERLAEKTKEVDPAGYGISQSAIGHMVSTGASGRERFTRRSCDLAAMALDKPIEELFTNTPTV
ncbi:helix-turn-helix domain-containing protein [Streptomyces globisporus]|uniref:helix-turn-helix domain-containing protein n=1 Tax=Streptomyces globisporus TaxID=1908 RepID=UPI003643B4AA